MIKNKNSNLNVFTRYVSLNVLGMLGLSCYILADTFFVSKGLGTDALAALNLAIPIYSFINGLGLMIGMGGATKHSLLKTNENKEKSSFIFSQSIIFAFAVSLMLVTIGIFNVSHLASLLGADAAVFENTKVYLRVILVFSPMFLINNILICFVRNDGNPKLSMIAMLTGSFSNILLDYIFIFVFKMGMFGAAFATGLAPVISIAILMFHFIQKLNNFDFLLVKPSIQIIFDIVSLGISFLITEFSAGIVMIVFNVLILTLKGNIGVAAYGVVANLSLVTAAIFTGIAQGIQPIISQAHGKNEASTIKKTYLLALISAFTITAGIYFSIYFFAEPIVNIFNKNHNLEFLNIASTGLRIYFTAFIFVGFNIITTVRFNSVGNSKKSFIVSILRGFLFIIPLAFILGTMFEMTGVWLAYPLAEFLTSIVCLVIFLKEKIK